MIAIAGGIVLAIIVLAVLPFVGMALLDWKWWRCWALGHRWERWSERYSTGMLTWTAKSRCRRCKKLSPQNEVPR